MFCNGLFRIIHPEEFQDFADEYNSDSFNKIVLPFMVMAFGYIFAYVNIRYGIEKVLSNNIALLLNKCIFNKSILEVWFKIERYEAG